MAEITTDHLNVEIRDTSKVHFTGKVKWISSKNIKGPFDVLPVHENFISVIVDDVSIKLPSGEIKKFPCKAGIIRVSSNMIHLFLNIETLDGEFAESLKDAGMEYYNEKIVEGEKEVKLK